MFSRKDLEVSLAKGYPDRISFAVPWRIVYPHMRVISKDKGSTLKRLPSNSSADFVDNNARRSSHYVVFHHGDFAL